MHVQGQDERRGAPGMSRRMALRLVAAVTVGGAASTALVACGAGGHKVGSPQVTDFTAPGPAVQAATANPADPKTMYAFTKTGQILMIGFGNNIFGTADQFGFLYAPASGDGAWSVRVSQQEHTSDFAKAGLMVRGSTDPGAPFVDMLAIPGGDAEVLEWRDSAGASAGRIPHGPGHPHAPIFLQLTKKGQVFTGAISTDGSSWHNHYQHTASAFGSKYLVGLAACSQSTKYGLDVFSHLKGFTPTAYAAIGA